MFPRRFKELRQKKKISQKQLADSLSLSRATISAYESGKRTPDIDTLQQIANYFEVSTDYLLGSTNSIYDPHVFNLLTPDFLGLIKKAAALECEERKFLEELIEFGLLQIEKGRYCANKNDTF